ncbi:MAG: hypothetical protein MMC33_008858 [Icmadophila ericetorum]|nr:hypothetical protein [Icmadophila ericetorum]
MAAFPFLRLPCELRQLVYEMCLVCRPYIDIKQDQEWAPDDDKKCALNPNYRVDRLGKVKVYKDAAFGLMRVSRQVHDEAIPFVYGANLFRFANYTHFRTFRRDCQSYLGYIRHISLHLPFPKWHWYRLARSYQWPVDGSVMLKELPNLEDIVFFRNEDLDAANIQELRDHNVLSELVKEYRIYLQPLLTIEVEIEIIRDGGKGISRFWHGRNVDRPPVFATDVIAYFEELSIAILGEYLSSDWFLDAWIDREGHLHYDGDPDSDCERSYEDSDEDEVSWL